MRYYPDFSRYTAVRRFREEIHNTPELLQELKRLGYDERKRYFPVFMMTSYVDAAIQRVNNAFLVNDKDGLNDPKTVELLKNQIKGSVESYHRIVHDVEQRTKELEAKQDTADGLSEDEEKELLNLHVELSKIDPAANPLSPDKMQTEAVKDLRSIVSLSEEILKSLNK
jgi:hypothetical protein